MKRFSAPVLLLLLAVVMGVSSCDKNDDADRSRAARIIGNWDLTSVAIDLDQNGTADASEMLPLSDNLGTAKLRFQIDHTGMVFTNIGPFNANEDFRWGFEEGEHTLIINALDNNVSLSVVSFDDGNMTLLFQQPGLPAVWETFHKQ